MKRFSRRKRASLPPIGLKPIIVALLLVGLLAAAACREGAPLTTNTPPTGTTAAEQADAPSTAQPTPTITAPPPSPTPQLAALVNGQPILLEAFVDELVRYKMAQDELEQSPDMDTPAPEEIVLDALIERELIRQAATAAGISVAAGEVEAKLADLHRTANENGSFEEWLVANQWNEEDFAAALATEMLIEAMVAHVTADVPLTTEQVRARYIQVDDAALAQSLAEQLADGADFAELATRYSRDVITGPAGGDLGFFARGSLLVPEVEDVAFGLAIDEVSDVLAVTDPQSGETRHYLIQVTDRVLDRPLDSNMRFELLDEAFATWLNELQAGATVTRFVDGS